MVMLRLKKLRAAPPHQRLNRAVCDEVASIGRADALEAYLRARNATRP